MATDHTPADSSKVTRAPVAPSVFFMVSGTRPLYLDPPPPQTILVCLALMTATYFAANSGLTASIVALANRQPLRSV